jgi:hypothetical protein
MNQNKGGTEDLITDIVPRFFLAGSTFVATYLIQLLFLEYLFIAPKGLLMLTPVKN